MGTDARPHINWIIASAVLLAGIALALCASSAHAARAIRHYDAVCNRGTPQERRCSKPFNEAVPHFHLSVPKTCRTGSVTAASAADNPKTIRHLAIRVDGETVGTTSPERPHWVGVSIDFATLTVGDHVVTATLRRRDGSAQKLTRTLTRLPGPEPDTVFKTLARRHADGVCDPGTPQERRCSLAVPDPRDASRLAVARTCSGEQAVRVTANAKRPATLRSLVLRLDGRLLATARDGGRRYWVTTHITCSDLAIGPHLVTATIRRRNGSVQTLTRTLQRVPAPHETTR